jgi:hypothetical protein
MSEEQEQLPDWLLSMRGQSLDEQPAQQPDVLPPFEQPPLPQEEAVAPPVAPPGEPLFESLLEDAAAAEEPEEPEDTEDMVDLLRDMAQQPDAGFDDYVGEEVDVSGVIPGMKPWQSLILAVLFFADVAVCGCMALAMLGKIEF